MKLRLLDHDQARLKNFSFEDVVIKDMFWLEDFAKLKDPCDSFANFFQLRQVYTVHYIDTGMK